MPAASTHVPAGWPLGPTAAGARLLPMLLLLLALLPLWLLLLLALLPLWLLLLLALLPLWLLLLLALLPLWLLLLLALLPLCLLLPVLLARLWGLRGSIWPLLKGRATLRRAMLHLLWRAALLLLLRWPTKLRRRRRPALLLLLRWPTKLLLWRWLQRWLLWRASTILLLVLLLWWRKAILLLRRLPNRPAAVLLLLWWSAAVLLLWRWTTLLLRLLWLRRATAWPPSRALCVALLLLWTRSWCGARQLRLLLLLLLGWRAVGQLRRRVRARLLRAAAAAWRGPAAGRAMAKQHAQPRLALGLLWLLGRLRRCRMCTRCGCRWAGSCLGLPAVREAEVMVGGRWAAGGGGKLRRRRQQAAAAICGGLRALIPYCHSMWAGEVLTAQAARDRQASRAAQTHQAAAAARKTLSSSPQSDIVYNGPPVRPPEAAPAQAESCRPLWAGVCLDGPEVRCGTEAVIGKQASAGPAHLEQHPPRVPPPRSPPAAWAHLASPRACA